MKLTDSAAEAILGVMKRRKLDPKKIVFEFRLLENGAVGIGFNQERQGQAQQYGDLTVMIGYGVDMGNTIVDFGEVKGKKGIIFLDNNHET
jgi:hypothetical protein